MAQKFNDGRTVVVLSEDAVLRAGLARMLALRGFRTLEAASEEDAVACCRHAVPNLLLADFSRSPLDDFASAQSIRERAELRDVPLLIISGAKERCTESRTPGYVAEVFNFDQMLFLLSHLLPKPRSRQPRPDGRH